MRRIVGFGSFLLLVASSGVIGSSATASAAVGKRLPSLSSFAVQPTSVNFGNTPVNTTASIPVLVTIDAGYEFSDPAMLVDWGESSPASGGCDGFVGPGNCIEDLTFSPNSTGDQTNVFEIDEVPANGSPGGESLYVDESGVGVSCPSTENSYMMTASTTDGTLSGVFCINSSGVTLASLSGTGTYTQDAFDGAPSVSGEAVFDLEGGTTTAVGVPAAPAGPGGSETLVVQAVGPDLLLFGSLTEGLAVAPGTPVPEVAKPLFQPPQVLRVSRFEEDAPLETSVSFTLLANLN